MYLDGKNSTIRGMYSTEKILIRKKPQAYLRRLVIVRKESFIANPKRRFRS